MRKQGKVAIVVAAIYSVGLLASLVIIPQYCKQYFMQDDEPALCNYFVNEPSLGSDVMAFTLTVILPGTLLLMYVQKDGVVNKTQSPEVKRDDIDS